MILRSMTFSTWSRPLSSLFLSSQMQTPLCERNIHCFERTKNTLVMRLHGCRQIKRSMNSMHANLQIFVMSDMHDWIVIDWNKQQWHEYLKCVTMLNEVILIPWRNKLCRACHNLEIFFATEGSRALIFYYVFTACHPLHNSHFNGPFIDVVRFLCTCR